MSIPSLSLFLITGFSEEYYQEYSQEHYHMDHRDHQNEGRYIYEIDTIFPSDLTTILWSPTMRRSSIQNGKDHWKKHGAEFPELHNSTEYMEYAYNFLNDPPRGTLTKFRRNGDIIRYHPDSNTFGVLSKEGLPKTLFRPDPKYHQHKTNLEYFYGQ